METHPVDPIALVGGLLFSLFGLALLADQNWDDVDSGALTAAGITLIGLVLAAVVVSRFVGGDGPATADAGADTLDPFIRGDESTDDPIIRGDEPVDDASLGTEGPRGETDDEPTLEDLLEEPTPDEE